jgi:hypothetical protein
MAIGAATANNPAAAILFLGTALLRGLSKTTAHEALKMQEPGITRRMTCPPYL